MGSMKDALLKAGLKGTPTPKAENEREKLSKNVRRMTDEAAERARSEGRKTIMDKDFR